ncbi:Histone-lysine N-methyltransferase ASHR1 [Zancudomyces culisetae]|uniref:Histone-lysine N-methyltransferase ASHR1 n=1 Tax=Zancudomyces culisetae TaxID=1213189 RepID=A0A1R1PC37_ZANCU|nr:Histone-lysine N-methyltransferase ASHR1 [Zancudomyces culisetae]|eukprot:OMH78432.1 Histone-lysine N-methyltransferase ASHR1 [Zancudomyces culisetae]
MTVMHPENVKVEKTNKKKVEKVNPFVSVEKWGGDKLKFKTSVSKGRHLVAGKNIAPGTEIATEKASVFIIGSTSSRNLCHNCMKAAKVREVKQAIKNERGEAIPGKTTTYFQAEIFCQKCEGMAVYCSEECKEEHGKEGGVHDKECKGLSVVREKCGRDMEEEEKLRMLVRYLNTMEQQKNDDKVFVAGGEQPTPIKYIKNIPVHREGFEKNWITQTTQQVRDIIKAMGNDKPSRQEVSEAVDFCCTYKSKSQQFCDTLYRGNPDFVGIFPMVSIYLSHSCEPNCVIWGDNSGQLRIRSIVDISEGTPYTINLTDLYQPREHRRRDLYVHRHFWCKCKRCNTPLSKSTDRFMDGITCQMCHKGLMIFEETREVEDVNAFVNSADILTSDIANRCAVCDNCKHSIKVLELVAILRSTIEQYSLALRAYRSRDFGEAKSMFESLLRKYDAGSLNPPSSKSAVPRKQILHPSNSYIVNSILPLMYCCRLGADFRSATFYCRLAIEKISSSGALPKNHPELTELRVTLAELVVLYANATKESAQDPLKSAQNNGKSAAATVSKKLFKDAHDSLALALTERTVALGPDHPRTIQVRSLQSSLSKLERTISTV